MTSVGWLLLTTAVLLWPVGPPRFPRREVPAAATGLTRGWRAVLAGAAVGGAVLMVWPSAFVAAVLAAPIGGAAIWFADRPAAGRGSRANSGQLAVLFDLWAAGLESGLGVGAALIATLDACGLAQAGADPADGTIGRLSRISGLLQLGADGQRAWLPADDDPVLAPIAAAARRSHAAGAELADTIREQARVVRRSAFADAQRRAERAGVLMAAPLALCFLPAFICLGLAPVIIALVGTLDIGR